MKLKVVMFKEPLYTHEVGHLAILRPDGFVECGERCGFWCYSRDPERKKLEVINRFDGAPRNAIIWEATLGG
jgi:hypothetical protein